MKGNKYIRKVAGILFLVTMVICGETYAQKGGGTVKKPFQKTITATIPQGGNSAEAEIAIPDGKMLVIENANARLVGTAGFTSISFATWFDDNGNGQVDASDESVHDVVMTYQVVTAEELSFTIFAGHARTLVFAAGRIGTTPKGIKMSVRSSFLAEVPTTCTLTISGYLEDLQQ